MNEFEQLRLDAYESSKFYEEKTKKWHDKCVLRGEFEEGDLVLLFNSCLKLFSMKLRCSWSGPFKVVKIFSYGVMEVWSKTPGLFKVNDQ